MLAQLYRRLLHLLHRDRYARDLDDEMRLHVDLRARQLREQGVHDASHAARRQFGNSTLLQENSAALWGWPAWERLAQDLRLAFRTLRKTPAFTITAVATLALGLGIHTAVFSMVNAVMLRSLPYPEPHRLVSLEEEIGGARHVVAPANLADYQQRTQSFTGLAGYDIGPMNLTGAGTPERITGEHITPNFFDVLGVSPSLGRSFLAEEDRPNGAPVAIITDDLWRRRWNADPDVLSRTITLDDRPYQIVGVLPRGFQSPSQFTTANRIEFYVLAGYSKDLLASRGDHEIHVLGRLKTGISLAAAQAELSVVSDALAHQYVEDREVRAVVTNLQSFLVQKAGDSMWAILGASSLIVLITCINVANLLLVRALAKRHETSVRYALGASRLRVVRQFLAESMLVAAAGCLAGIALGRLLMNLLVAIAPPNIPRLDAVTMDWRVFAVATLLATITGAAFGIAPAWQASRTRPAESLKSSERQTGGLAQIRWRAAFTVAEVAVSLILLIGAGLLLESFVRLMSVDLGFQPERVLAININLPESRYRTAVQRLQFFESLAERVQPVPGVQSVAFANQLPLRASWGSGFFLETRPNSVLLADFQAVSPSYFPTLGIALTQGRLLAPSDRTGQPPVAAVNQQFARQFLNGQNPMGRRIRRSPDAPWIEIVGVVSDIRRRGKTGDLAAEVYLAAAQTVVYPARLADFAVRTVGDPRQLVHAIQQQVWALDKDQPVTNVKTLEEIISASVAERRFQTLLLAIFAAVAVALAMIGVFGVLSYSVSQRTSELGLRIALGASPRGILALVLRQAGTLVAAGVGLGLAGAWALTRFLQSLLFQVRPTDWLTYLSATALLAVVSLAASLIPARRGSRVDPMVALRYE